ncbi:MAG: SRPBCC domain-containing protein [Bacteroidota bacterium]|nr:SRPBCC domain-containing protein [Bacteroidota bacterium]
MKSFKLSVTLPVGVSELYKAWLNSKQHTAFTGGEANCSAKLNGEFTAWDGYISGKNLELVPDEKIVQEWRAADFAEGDKSSLLQLRFESAGKGKTKLTLLHSQLPDDLVDSYKKGWGDHYFIPMKSYYSKKK